MINRIIEPSGGKIYVNGENVIDQDSNELRKNIGYVIQKVGLFPHYSVFDNIAIVPRLLGWEEERIEKRVVELLNTMNLDPDENRNKFPKALSGGQSQRVGVARAMAGNPPVMLMDEPFGAVDPITRNQLQNEFLKLQKTLKKTICFVTHDIDEAIKLGDKIAIMNDGELVQYDTPENILFAPANDFVKEFVGADRSLKVLNLLRVDTVMRTKIRRVKVDADIQDLKHYFSSPDKNRILIENEQNQVIGYVSKADVEKASTAKGWNRAIKLFPASLNEHNTLKDAMSDMLQHNIAALPVLSREGKMMGIVTFSDIRDYIGEAYEEQEQEEEVL
jgi:osmoprotectant transport system ATP-binding protein